MTIHCGFLGDKSGYEQIEDEQYDIIPIKIMNNVKDIAKYSTYPLIIKTDDSLWGWGHVYYGEEYIKKENMIKIMDNVKYVHSSNGGYAVIKNDNSLWIWGLNFPKRFYNIKYDTVDEFVKMMEDVKSVVLRYDKLIILKNDGTIYISDDNLTKIQIKY